MEYSVDQTIHIVIKQSKVYDIAIYCSLLLAVFEFNSHGRH